MRYLGILFSTILLLMVLIYSCNLFKDVDTQKDMTRNSLQSSSSQTSSSSLLKEKEADLSLQMRDSGNQRYQVVLWPRGKFSFSPDSGFRGEAEKVMITGNASSLKTTDLVARQTEKLKADSQSKMAAEKKDITNQSHKNKSQNVSWIVLIVIGVALVVLSAWSYKKIKSIHSLLTL